MANGFFNVPVPTNEPVKEYRKNSAERIELEKVYQSLKNSQQDIPMYIGTEQVRTEKTIPLFAPHDIKCQIGQFHEGDASHASKAIDAALAARDEWASLPWEQRAAVFLKAADLLAGPFRAKMNAATMLCQSKNAYQAEIDAACELIDFFKYNVKFMTDIYKQQPESNPGLWNRMEHRALEGFVFAITPFNFTSICGQFMRSTSNDGQCGGLEACQFTDILCSSHHGIV